MRIVSSAFMIEMVMCTIFIKKLLLILMEKPKGMG